MKRMRQACATLTRQAAKLAFKDQSPEALAKIAERRRHARLPVGLYASYWVAQPERAKEGVLVTENASAGGLMFRSQGAFRVGDGLRLEMHLPDRPEKVRVHARVVRVEADPGTAGMQRVALRFTRIEQAVRRRLVQSLASHVFTSRDLAIIRA